MWKFIYGSRVSPRNMLSTHFLVQLYIFIGHNKTVDLTRTREYFWFTMGQDRICWLINHCCILFIFYLFCHWVYGSWGVDPTLCTAKELIFWFMFEEIDSLWKIIAQLFVLLCIWRYSFFLSLDQWFSVRGVFAPRRYLATLQTFLIAMARHKEYAMGVQ